jgi:hypothetical protein
MQAAREDDGKEVAAAGVSFWFAMHHQRRRPASPTKRFNFSLGRHAWILNYLAFSLSV